MNACTLCTGQTSYKLGTQDRVQEHCGPFRNINVGVEGTVLVQDLHGHGHLHMKPRRCKLPSRHSTHGPNQIQLRATQHVELLVICSSMEKLLDRGPDDGAF